LIEANRLCVRPQLRPLVETGGHRREVVVFERLEVPLRDLRLARDSLERKAAQLTSAPEHFTEAVTAAPTRARELSTPVFRSGGAYGSHGRHCFQRICGLDRTHVGQSLFQRRDQFTQPI
jgi:hypothetical protein